mgnify:CR=1 FL=1
MIANVKKFGIDIHIDHKLVGIVRHLDGISG